jgi:hypothetical protein
VGCGASIKGPGTGICIELLMNLHEVACIAGGIVREMIIAKPHAYVYYAEVEPTFWGWFSPTHHEFYGHANDLGAECTVRPNDD